MGSRNKARTQRIWCVRQYTLYECIFSCCNQLMVNELGVCHLNLRIEWGYCVIYWVWKSSYRKIQQKKSNERTNGRSNERAVGCVDEPDEYEEEETNVKKKKRHKSYTYMTDFRTYLYKWGLCTLGNSFLSFFCSGDVWEHLRAFLSWYIQHTLCIRMCIGVHFAHEFIGILNRRLSALPYLSYTHTHPAKQYFCMKLLTRLLG